MSETDIRQTVNNWCTSCGLQIIDPKEKTDCSICLPESNHKKTTYHKRCMKNHNHNFH